MSKKYSATDYEKLAERYRVKAQEAHEKEVREYGELFLKYFGKRGLPEAERFLVTAGENNRQYGWFVPLA